MKITWSKKGVTLFFTLFALLLLVVGCSDNTGKTEEANNEGEEGNNAIEDKEEVVITIAHPFGDDIFEDRYLSIEGLSDHITLDHVYWDESREGLEELFADGIEPDIFNTGNVSLLQEYDAVITIDELIERHNFDTSVIQPSLVSFLRSFDESQEMIGVPDGGSYYALFFNEEIFDIFGVPYPDPEKPMTWKETLELSKKLTGERNGIDYIGLEFNGNDMSAPINQFGVNMTDPETGEVLVTEKDEIKSYLELVQDYYNIPGMKDPKNIEECVFCEERAAMSVSWHGMFLWGWGEDPSNVEHMDIAPLPVWPEKPTTGPYLSSYPIMVSNLTDHPDEAFEVLMGYVSEQNQLAMSRAVSAGPTTLYSSVQDEFAGDNPFYDGKNTDALFVLDPEIGEERQSAKWDGYVPLGDALDKIRTSDTDVPTLLREMKEEAEINIENARGSGE